MVTVSLCMIVRNEEAHLAHCLRSVKDLVDEIIIVDTGSTDQTKEIARSFSCRLFDFPWQDNFAAARNFSFAQATMDFCFWLDADDCLLPEDQERFRQLKAELTTETDVVFLPYHTALRADGSPAFTCYRERLLLRKDHFRWEGNVHEAITPRGRLLYGTAAITHCKKGPGDTQRNLRIFENMLAQGCTLSPREQFYYARELQRHGFCAKAAALLLSFLQEKDAWIENQIEACRNLAQCYYALSNPDKALAALFHALSLSLPRAEICCDIGLHFLQHATPPRHEQAAFWYELALCCPRRDQSGGFVLPDCYGYIPHMQLCVCYYAMGNSKKARQHNEAAGQIHPDDPAYLSNCRFFDSIAPGTP